MRKHLQRHGVQKPYQLKLFEAPKLLKLLPRNSRSDLQRLVVQLRPGRNQQFVYQLLAVLEHLLQCVVVDQNQVLKYLLLFRLLGEVYVFMHLFQRDVELRVLRRLVLQGFDLLTRGKQLGQVVDNRVQLRLVRELEVLQRGRHSNLEPVQVLDRFLYVLRQFRQLLHI